MKLLGTLFRLLCALIVLLCVATYLDGPLQVTVPEYLAAFTPEHVQAMADAHTWIAIAAGALLLLALVRGLKLVWNIAYCLATLAFFAEVAVMTLGPELALPTPARGLGWEQLLAELAVNYPLPAIMIPSLCILGCLCSSAPVRIAWTSLVCCALCYGCAELFYYLMLQWQAMPEPCLPQALELIQALPWTLAALPAVFFVQYALFMALFETFIPRKKKVSDDEEQEPVKADDAKKEEKAPAAKETKPAAAATATVAATSVVVVKKPVIHKKSPISPAGSQSKSKAEAKAEPKEETKAEAKEEAPAEPSKPESPAETKEATPADAPAKEEAPKADAPAEQEAPKADASAKDEPKAEEPAKEEAKAETKSDEKAEEAPAKPAIPSVPMPPPAEA